MISPMEKLVSPQHSRPSMICHSSGLPPFACEASVNSSCFSFLQALCTALPICMVVRCALTPAKGKLHRGIGRADANLALAGCPSVRERHDAEQVMRSLADLRRIVLNR